MAGLALYDTMQHIKSEVVTINVGLAASMASFIMCAGSKGKRLALPNSRIMIHQPMGGAQGECAQPRRRGGFGLCFAFVSSFFISIFRSFAPPPIRNSPCPALLLFPNKNPVAVTYYIYIYIYKSPTLPGQAEDIKVEAAQIMKVRDNLVDIYAKQTGQTTEQIIKDLDRDNFMSAQEALEYGLIDQVIELSELDEMNPAANK